MRHAAFLVLLASAAFPDTWYVNNRTGDDARDGRSEATAFATIARALEAAGTSDTLVLADTGVPYREAIELRGLGGTPAAPFVIEGNGATLTGLKPVPPDRWQPQPNGALFFPVARKPYGFPFLVQRRRQLPQAVNAEAIRPGQFFWDDKGIHFRPEAGKSIADYELEATLVVSGVAISGSSYITCRDLVSEFHSNDGFNVHGDCRGCVFESIEARHNGDDGFSVHETIGATVRNAFFHRNRWGIQDVNASRSVFNGVTCEHNAMNGAHFVGGYHSLVDCIVRDNGREQILVTGEQPRHLIGSEHNPLCHGLAFLQNCLVVGGTAGLAVGKGARVTARNCVFVRSEVGVLAREGAACHLTTSIVTECATRELDGAGDAFFRDHNLYDPGRFRWLGKDYGPEQWDAFRAAAGHDQHSLLAAPRLRRHDTWDVLPDSPALKAKPRIGPTEPIRGCIARRGAWGEPVLGLRIRLDAEQGEVPVGARPVFWLHFRFDPEGADPNFNLLNRFLHPRCVSLTFNDRDTGRRFERRPDGGVPELPMMPRPEDYAELRGRPLAPQRLRVRLLTSNGQQLPPGRYTVAATYRNEGETNQDDYRGPWRFWSGTLTAPPTRLTVLPVEPEEIEVRFHPALELRREGDRIGWRWSEERPRTLRLTRRPGYFLATRYETRVFLDGKEVEHGGGGLASSTWLAGGESFLPPEIVRRVLAGASLRIREDVAVLETSNPPGHMWSPESGDHRVLWQGSVEGALPPDKPKDKP